MPQTTKAVSAIAATPAAATNIFQRAEAGPAAPPRHRKPSQSSPSEPPVPEPPPELPLPEPPVPGPPEPPVPELPESLGLVPALPSAARLLPDPRADGFSGSHRTGP